MNSPAKKFIDIFSQNLSYCDPNLKEEFHSEGKKVLRKIAKQMGLSSVDYELRSNKAGIAVSGEITLHTSNLYVQIGKTCMGDDSAILMRSCKDRNDYVGGMNHFAPITALEDLERFAIYLDGVSMNQVCGMHWNPSQARYDIAHIRANKIISPQLEKIRDRFENGEIPIDVFEQAIDNAERVRSAA